LNLTEWVKEDLAKNRKDSHMVAMVGGTLRTGSFARGIRTPKSVVMRIRSERMFKVAMIAEDIGDHRSASFFLDVAVRWEKASHSVNR